MLPSTQAYRDAVEKLVIGEYHDPHAILGLHDVDESTKVIRIWRPGAQDLSLEVFGETVRAHKVHPAGLFEYRVPRHTTWYDYRIWHQNGLLANDPYAFAPSLGDTDQYLFNRGVHYNVYEILGAHYIPHHGCMGTRFAVWAPSAKRVSVVADSNHWHGLMYPMRSMGQSGLWELFIPGITYGEKYKFEIKTQAGGLRIKSDPYAYWHEHRPATASIVANVDGFTWTDNDWLERRARDAGLPKPMNTYEVHLGSWRRKDGHLMGYRDLAHQLVDYCKEMGYTHIELLPVQEHPLDESWGYQVTGYFAVTSRHGTPEDFQYFVNHLHMNNIGVILDWVPGHFPTDDHSLARFDGTALYEHEDPRQGFHPHWGTHIFNFGRLEVSNFLIASALFWVGKMHIDGLRVDAVASMLYLDYGRDGGEWIPNRYGGKENIDAIEFMRHMNSVLHKAFPGALTIAEESTSFAGVSHPVEHHGLGFDMKWNMGWMNDTLRYFSKEPIYRVYHHNDLTFGLLYAFAEKFILVFSHDEVVHGKRALLSKMPGPDWEKFANMRLLHSYMICQPGKKLLFQGADIGQWDEWDCNREIQWHLLQWDGHRQLQKCMREMNHFYLQHRCLWERDFDWRGFEWVDFSDAKNSVVSYLRKGIDSHLFCVHHLTADFHQEYTIKLKNVAWIREVFNTDAECYGGSGKINQHPEVVYGAFGEPYAVKLVMPPLATMIFEVGFR